MSEKKYDNTAALAELKVELDKARTEAGILTNVQFFKPGDKAIKLSEELAKIYDDACPTCMVMAIATGEFTADNFYTAIANFGITEEQADVDLDEFIPSINLELICSQENQYYMICCPVHKFVFGIVMATSNEVSKDIVEII